MSNLYKFWLVWSPEGKTMPTFRHQSEFAAQTEAERLARWNPGKQFFVVEAKSVSRIEPKPVITTLLHQQEEGSL